VSTPGRQSSALVHTVNARARSLRASPSYLFVLLLIVVSFLFTAFVPEARWARGALC
jgi:hypothetical protein